MCVMNLIHDKFSVLRENMIKQICRSASVCKYIKLCLV